jgi:hypothetical protein
MRTPTESQITHYLWCAQQEGKRAIRAIERYDLHAHIYARHAAHWAKRYLDTREAIDGASK